MGKSIFALDTPKDCLHCKMRTCIHTQKNRYQLCGFQIAYYGYGTEAFFKEEDLKNGWKSPKCPLVDEEEYICNSEIYREVTDIGYIAKHYDVDAILNAQNE